MGSLVYSLCVLCAPCSLFLSSSPLSAQTKAAVNGGRSGTGGAHRSADAPAGIGAAARLCVQRAVLCHPHGRAADAGQPRGGGAAVCGPAAGGIPHGGAAVPDAGRGRAGSTRAGGNHSAARTGRGDRAGGSDLPEALRLCAVLPAAGGRVRGIAATAVGGAARHAAGSVFRLRSGRPHRADYLYLTHPITNKQMSFKANLPNDMDEFLNINFQRENINDKLNENNIISSFNTFI